MVGEAVRMLRKTVNPSSLAHGGRVVRAASLTGSLDDGWDPHQLTPHLALEHLMGFI
jgi:hypothetical protein